mgnify:CR=1 FL=1
MSIRSLLAASALSLGFVLPLAAPAAAQRAGHDPAARAAPAAGISAATSELGACLPPAPIRTSCNSCRNRSISSA